MDTPEELCKIMKDFGVECGIHSDVEDFDWLVRIGSGSLPFFVDVLKTQGNEIYQIYSHHIVPPEIVAILGKKGKNKDIKDKICRIIMQQGYFVYKSGDSMVIDGEDVGVVYSANKVFYLKDNKVERIFEEVFNIISLNKYIKYIVDSYLADSGKGTSDEGLGNMFM